MIGQKLQRYAQPEEFSRDMCKKAPSRNVITHVDSDWAGGTDRCSTSSGVELHGKKGAGR